MSCLLPSGLFLLVDPLFLYHSLQWCLIVLIEFFLSFLKFSIVSLLLPESFLDFSFFKKRFYVFILREREMEREERERNIDVKEKH